jgi:lipoate---protein ligase
VGAVPSARFVSAPRELFDYDEIRGRSASTMTAVTVLEPLVVLGSRQGIEVLSGVDPAVVRRRRGGGGVVLAQPGDVWVDWWITPDDGRWADDVRASALTAGEWWRDALDPLVRGVMLVHPGPLEGAAEHRVACFAGRGPGEIFVDGKKAVGVTQWRVREGTLVSTVLPAHPSNALLELLSAPPPGLGAALDHHTTASLRLDDPAVVLERLASASGPWVRGEVRLP